MSAGAGMRVIGVIRKIELHAVPSIIKGTPPRVVTRIDLDIDDARAADGSPVDRRNLIGLPFEGPPELADRFAAGARVRVDTTTATGTHIARIEPLQ